MELTIKCKICGKEAKKMRNDGTCYGGYCYMNLCKKCKGVMKVIATLNVDGYCCDSTDVEALYCKTCDIGEIRTV